MILIVAMSWLIVSALTLLFIAGANASQNPSYNPQLMVEPESMNLAGHETSLSPAAISQGPKVELPQPVNRAS